MPTFGVEIECLVPVAARLHLARNIMAAGVPCRDVNRYHSGLDQFNWKLEVDGSLRADPGTVGVELVSPPMIATTMSRPVAFEEIEKLCRVLDRLDASVNRSCGLHVHIGVATIPVNAVRKLVALYVEHEALIDQLIPSSRRGNANSYCQSVASRANMQALIQATTIRDISQALGDVRHAKLNLTSYWRYSTVEFRHHSGTVDAAKITKWIAFCCKMVESAIRNANQPITFANTVQVNRWDPGVPAHWRRNRVRRTVFQLLSRAEGATSEELRAALNRGTRPPPQYFAGSEVTLEQVGRRNGFTAFRLPSANPTPGATPAPVSAPVTLTDLYEKLGLADEDKEFWQERAAILSAGVARRRSA